MTLIRSTAVGCGAYLPERVVTNDDLAKRVDTSDEWITTRSGIKRRHFAREDQSTSDLAVAAARDALEMAGMTGADIDLIVLATSTPDQTFPSTATRVQAALEASNAAAFDIQAVCSGFIFALATADNFIRGGQAKTAMVIGAETFSRILDWEDRSTCVLFGDGAGAVILQAEEAPGENSDRGVLTTCLRSDGRFNNILYVDGGPSTSGHAGYVRMAGREVFKHAVVKLAEVAHEAMDKICVSSEDVDWIVPHQANIRIIESTAKKAGVPMEKVVVTVHEHGNTSAASIPLALNEAVRDGRIKKGDLLLMEAIGGGLAWGSALLRW